MAGAVTRQLEFHLRDDEAVEIAPLETAGAIAEFAVGVRELHELERLAIHRFDAGDGARDVLSVGADVLHWRAADLTRNPRQAFEPRAFGGNRRGDERIPRLARTRAEAGSILARVGTHAAKIHVNDETVETLVREDDVAAAAEDVHGHFRVACPLQHIMQLTGVCNVRKRPRFPTDGERAPIRQAHAVIDVHASCWSETRRSDRSRAMSAAAASWREAQENSMRSPGASCPAIGRSAAITDAILG